MEKNDDKVKVTCDDSDVSEALQGVVLKFAKKIGKDVSIFSPETPYRPRERQGIRINLYCSPVECEDDYELKDVYGFELISDQTEAYELPVESEFPEGYRIIDSNGYEVAWISGNTLYILFNIACEVWSDEKNYANLILDLIIDDYYLYLTQPDLFAGEMAIRQHRKFISAYRTGLAGASESSIKEMQSRINDISEALAGVVRDQKILSLQETESEVFETQSHELFERLRSMSVGGRVKISDDRDNISIFVGQIDIKYEGVVYAIGEFEVGVDVSDCTVWFRNLTESVRGYAHPNIDHNDRFCLGDASYGVAVLWGNMEIDTIMSMMIQFLKTYNPKSCFKDIKEWPVKEEVQGNAKQ